MYLNYEIRAYGAEFWFVFCSGVEMRFLLSSMRRVCPFCHQLEKVFMHILNRIQSASVGVRVKGCVCVCGSVCVHTNPF